MSGDTDRRTIIFVAAALIAVIAVVVGAIVVAGGGGNEEGSSSPAPAEAPSGAAPPGVAAQLPPGIAECLADQGVDIEGTNPQEIFHGGTVPPEVLDACFSALHQGGGSP